MKKLNMNIKKILKLCVILFLFVMFSVSVLADDNKQINSLSQIFVNKPFDNNYQLGLSFKNHFNGNAFIQKRGNGSFYVYVPDTIMASKNIKVIYKDKVKKDDVKINIEEHPFVKNNIKSKYIKLSVNTPINSDIQLVAQTNLTNAEKSTSPVMKLYFAIVGVLLVLIAILSSSIYKAMKSINNNSNTYTSFPSEFLNSPENYIKSADENENYEKNYKTYSADDKKMISPISFNDFSCFRLNKKQNSDIDNSSNLDIVANDEKIDKAKITNPIKKQVKQDNHIEECELDLPNAENLKLYEALENNDENDDAYRPELVTELKINDNKGFYLTTVDDNSFALFGYIGEKIFFLQRFSDLKQINLQARFYDNKDGVDIYIIRLESYKAMLAVSDDEIKELAVI